MTYNNATHGEMAQLKSSYLFCHPSLMGDTLDIYFHDEQLDLPSVSCCWGRSGEMWRGRVGEKSHFLQEEAATENRETQMERESSGVDASRRCSVQPPIPPIIAKGKRHWFLTHRHVKPPSDRYRRTGRSTHRHPLTKQSCILTSASCNTAKAQLLSTQTWKYPHIHTQTWTAEGEP